MDFFAQQDRARRATRWLVVLFVLSVIALVTALDVAAYWTCALDERMIAIRPQVLFWTTVAAVAAIAGGSAIKIAQLSGGGSTVAEMLGGKRLSGTASGAAERTLLHVVEEMSIASGVPMPLVYVLEEPGINAFAAGYRPSDAAITVTRGCLERLSRPQLQGVIGHEFSHLLNGDMRLNLQLVGLLSGILVIGETGRVLLRMSGWFDNPDDDIFVSSDDRRDRGGLVFLIGAGLALFVIGSGGYLLGRLIKAAISREREFLADAAAVQFTRDPASVAGALKQVGDQYVRSFIRNPRAEEFSHLFFGDAVRRPWTDLLATHPPMQARIRAIEPTWNGVWPTVAPIQPPVRPPTPVNVSATMLGADLVTGRIGRVVPEHLDYGRALLSRLPDGVAAAARETFGARAAVLALLIDDRRDIADRQWSVIAARDPALAAETQRLQPLVAPLGASARLPLFDLSIPALRMASMQQRESLLAIVDAVARADDTLTLPEAILARLLSAHLSGRTAPSASIYAMRPLLPSLSIVLTLLARYGADGDAGAREAFAVGCGKLLTDGQGLAFLPADKVASADLDRALDALAAASVGIKRRILNACAWCVAADGSVSTREAELLRLIADSLGCPLPPFHDLRAETAAA
jgi:Zn-dependent protease with chaperone function